MKLPLEVNYSRDLQKNIVFFGPCEVRTHDLGVISTTLYRLS